MNLDSKQSIAAQYEIVTLLTVDGADFIDDISKLKQLLRWRFLKLDGEFSWNWAANCLLRVRLLPSYFQIRCGLAENPSPTLLPWALTQLKTETDLHESFFDWALCVWLLSEITILQSPISDELVEIIIAPLSKNADYFHRFKFLARHFMRSKGRSSGALFALPFMIESVRRYPADARCRFDVARAQIDASQYEEAVETLILIDVDGSDLPGQVPYCGEADLLAEESFLRGRALGLLGLSQDTDVRRKPYLSQDEEACRALEYAVAGDGNNQPEYWHGLGQLELDEARKHEGSELRTSHWEGIRCVDRSLEVAHLRLLEDLQSMADSAKGELQALLAGPIMKAVVERQDLRTLRSLAEWARDHKKLDSVEQIGDRCRDLLIHQAKSHDDWSVNCLDGSYLAREMGFEDFRSMLRIETFQIMEIVGIGDFEAKLLTKMANNDADVLVKKAARKTLSSISEARQALSLISDQDDNECPSWILDQFREEEALGNQRATVFSYESFDESFEEIVKRVVAKYEASRDLSVESQKDGASLPVQTQRTTDNESPGEGTIWSASTERNLFFLSVKGTLESPQFVIETHDGKFWDGTGWNQDSEKGLLYSDAIIAARLCHEMRTETLK